ncbi:hypothetical protein E0Z10_g4072 [Xylaria hypoxylon]|uniref:Uncharacterized protein n=1 Tax=Xylaria hypoxylon TaxID=37992 RepID=A0A4Z0Z1S4_9PEZI|nr:hypothetical protein E0Z10_g4072 [Xylaria hypoxylon]
MSQGPSTSSIKKDAHAKMADDDYHEAWELSRIPDNWNPELESMETAERNMLDYYEELDAQYTKRRATIPFLSRKLGIEKLKAGNFGQALRRLSTMPGEIGADATGLKTL